MKINIDMVFHEISKVAKCTINGDVDKAILFNHVEFFSREKPVQQDVLYVCTPEDLSRTIKSGVFICTDKVELSPDNQGILIISTVGETRDCLYDLVVGAFRKYAEWDEALLAALNESEPMKVMVDCCWNIFENPISVISRDFHILVMPYNKINEDFSKNIPPEKSDYLTYETVNFFKNDPKFSIDNQRKKHYLYQFYLYNEEILPCQTLNVNIFWNNEYIARIVLFEEDHQFRPFDGILLEHLALFIKPCFSIPTIELIPDLKGLKDLLVSVLEGAGKRFVNKSTLASLGWSSEDTFIWLHLLQTEQDINNRTTRYTCIQIERIFPQTCAVQWQGGISVYANVTASQKTIDEYLGRFEQFSTEGGFRTGVSNQFSGTEFLVEYHQQAMIAVMTGKDISIDRWLYQFTDYAVPYLLQNAVKDLPVMLCCHPIIGMLSEYDNINGTEYINTLQCYLDNQMNAIITAKELFIHRSTMNYRLNRIKELCGLDWKDKELIFYLRLSLKIFQQK